MTSTICQDPPPAWVAWYGNAAKMRAIRAITADRRSKVIFDYGAGRGRGWVKTLAAHPEITLVCYEPSASAKALRTALPSVAVHSGNIAAVEGQADVVVSFSVLEHVYDRASYLHHARRLLKPGGRFFLNYDDGHFRSPGSFAERLRNMVAPALPRLGLINHYQSRVRRADADHLVREAGFAVVSDRYENLSSLKRLAPFVPLADRETFAVEWLTTEDRMNAEITGHGPMHRGDTALLWRQMASRTLELC